MPHYKPELARALFKKSQFVVSLMKSLGGDNYEDPHYQRAVKIYNELSSTTKLILYPGEEDFDSVVRFWSR
jgi:hypothetical protein